jgi:hypothetical protein
LSFLLPGPLFLLRENNHCTVEGCFVAWATTNSQRRGTSLFSVPAPLCDLEEVLRGFLFFGAFAGQTAANSTARRFPEGMARVGHHSIFDIQPVHAPPSVDDD